MSALLPLLADLREQRTFAFEEPWRLSSRSLGLAVPIVRKEYGPRGYVLLEELPGGVEVRDSGSIRRLIARSGVEKPVFIRGGLVMKGETQPRAVRFSVVILPGEEKAIEALCVDEARPIRTMARMAPARDVPARVLKELVKGDQAGVWREVRTLQMEVVPRYAKPMGEMIFPRHRARERARGRAREERRVSTRRFRVIGPEIMHFRLRLRPPITTDLLRISEALEEARKDIRDVIERFPLLKDQVGVVILDAKGVYAMELFDHPDSWSAIAKNAGRKFAEVLAEQAEFGVFKPDKEGIMEAIRAFLDKLAACDEEVVFKNRLSQTAVLRGEGVQGEYTVLEGSVIHLMAMRSEEERPHRPPEEEAPF